MIAAQINEKDYCSSVDQLRTKKSLDVGEHFSSRHFSTVALPNFYRTSTCASGWMNTTSLRNKIHA